MKSKFFLSLLAVLTIATFTSSASAATCAYNSNLACSVDTSPVGGTLGCTSYTDIYYNGNCIKNCSACSSGYTRTQQVYTDSSGCTISYYSCLLDASTGGQECYTTTYIQLPSDAQHLVASDADSSCMRADTSYRCTSGTPKYCVADCGTCLTNLDGTTPTVGSVTVTAPSGCTMTYQGCKSFSGELDDTIVCSSDADCGTASAWGLALMGKQSRTVPKCSSGSCTTNTEYRCVAGYYGTLSKVGLEVQLNCTKCSAGYYSSEASAMSCTACPDGSYTNAASGATSCLSCAEKTGNEYATSVAPAAGIGSCFVPAGTFTVGDETGNKGFVEDCYYEDDDSGIVVNPGDTEIGGVVTPIS
ncbi:MAG: hypothetical protein J6R22_01675 [Alphaproteobacteria bacterium]|nr:hypothetical protein [Alphaproteobacteria bacterium]